MDMSNNLFPRVGGIGTNMPSATFGGKVYPDQPFIKSNRAVALIEQVQYAPAYGHISLGTVLGIIAAGPKKGMVIPLDGGIGPFGGVAATATTFTVSEQQAAAFAVGDTLTFFRAATPAKASLGAVTAVSAPANGAVTVTFATAAPAGAASPGDWIQHTVDADSIVICDQSVFSSVTGALGSALLSNAVVYKSRIFGMTDEVRNAVGSLVEDFGDFYIIR